MHQASEPITTSQDSPRNAGTFERKLSPAITILSQDHPDRDRIVAALCGRLLGRDPEFRRFRPADCSYSPHMSDFVFAVEDELHHADHIFPRVRWGGQFVYASFDPANVATLPDEFASRGFETVRGPGYMRTGPMRFIPFMGRKLWYFVARKLFLTRPRDISERFTYHVQLAHPTHSMATADSYVVQKEVPTIERVVARLRAKFTDVPYSVIEKRAVKFTQKVFPLFLTREAAMLKFLQRDLPPEYRNRVPTLLQTELDERGYARRIWVNWLRISGKPMSQVDFALQSADLLRVVHDAAHIIHLDLRLDNFVITDHGVGFVDFGSAVRMGENIQANPMLATLFEELMKTSQIQRMLYKMKTSGTVTSKLISDAHGRVDKQVDLFYLAVQINQPLHNPDFAALVDYDPLSKEAQALAELTREILKPRDPTNPKYHSAAEMLAGIRRIKSELGGKSRRQFVGASPQP